MMDYRNQILISALGLAVGMVVGDRVVAQPLLPPQMPAIARSKLPPYIRFATFTPTVTATPTATATLTPTATATSTMEPNPTVTSPPNLVDNGDGTITDTANGLMWEQKDTNGGLHDVGNFYPWAIVNGGVGQPTAAAAALCLSGSGASAGCVNVGGASPTAWSWLADLNAVDGTGFAGHSDWRIPSQSELQGIVNLAIPNCGPGSGIPCIDPIFGPSSVFGYWSSTNDPTDNTMAEVVPMNSGATLNVSDVKTFDGYFVRAVRLAP